MPRSIGIHGVISTGFSNNMGLGVQMSKPRTVYHNHMLGAPNVSQWCMVLVLGHLLVLGIHTFQIKFTNVHCLFLPNFLV